MFINDFQSSNEYRLHQVLHTLKSVHGMELDLDSKDVSDLESIQESSEIIKNSIVNESRFNTYNSNPEYAKHMLIMEAVRLYLVEIAPKRQRRKVKESIGIEVDEEMINPAQDPNVQKQTGPNSNNKKPLKPGTVNMKNKATGKIENVPVNQVQSKQSRGDQVVGDDVSEGADPELAALMQKYGVDPAVGEGNEFSGARQAAIDSGENKFKVGNKTYMVTSETDDYSGGDWGSSDWYPVMKSMDEYLAKNGTSPETIEAAAEQEAEFYHDMMGYPDVEDAKDRIISMWLTRKGFKMEEDDHSVSNPDYQKLAKEHRKAAKAALDTNDDKDFNKHQDLSNYYMVKAGGKAPGHIVDVGRFVKYVEKEYINHLKHPSQVNESKFDHDGYQASMARSELYRNTKYSMDMLKMIKPEDDIQPWIASNLTKAANYLDKIYHYLDYYTKFEPEKLPEDQDPDIETTEMALGETTGSTARQDLMHVVEYSTKLFSMIQPGDKLEGWVAMKLTTASDCISSSKHYMEYQQFEKHAHDMLDNVNGMAEEGAKMKKKSVKESVGQMLMSMMINEDQDLAQAQTLLAAKAMSDDLQDIAEKVAKMSVEDLMPLVDTMKEQFGIEAAEGYNEMMKTSLEALLKSITDSKDTSDNAILQLQGGGVPSAAGSELPEPGVMPAADGEGDAEADVGAEPESDELEAPELPEEPLGRAKKDESISSKGKALNEKKMSAAQEKFFGKGKKKDDSKGKTDEKDEKKSGNPFAKKDVKEGKLAEKAPPGKKAEEFIKGAKADFKKRYGKDWEARLYATAWEKFGTKSESYVKAVKMLEASKENLARLENAFESHKKQYRKMVSEGTVQDPLKVGYGLEGELMVEKIGDLGGMISKLKEMLRTEIRRGASDMIMAEHNARKAERLVARKAAAPYGVIWLGETGARKGKFFESEKLRKYWLDLNARDLNEHQLVNPGHFDAEIQKLNRKG